MKPKSETSKSRDRQNLLQNLRAIHVRGGKLLAAKRIDENSLGTWSTSCAACVAQVFGDDSGHVQSFKDEYIGCLATGNEPDPRAEQRDLRKTLKERMAVLGQLVEQAETEIANETTSAKPSLLPEDCLWSLIHSKVVAIARQRFKAGHYADAMEAAMKELNTVVKEIVRKKTGQELDGAALMQRAFSPNPPVLIVLDDLSTESGKNVQQGYMQLSAGAMVGIRNPKAHANITITKERAWHHLFLASLLFYKLDERL